MRICEYAAAHNGSFDPVPAVTTIDCGPVGVIPACQACADLYERLSQ